MRRAAILLTFCCLLASSESIGAGEPSSTPSTGEANKEAASPTPLSLEQLPPIQALGPEPGHVVTGDASVDSLVISTGYPLPAPAQIRIALALDEETLSGSAEEIIARDPLWTEHYLKEGAGPEFIVSLQKEMELIGRSLRTLGRGRSWFPGTRKVFWRAMLLSPKGDVIFEQQTMPTPSHIAVRPTLRGRIMDFVGMLVLQGWLLGFILLPAIVQWATPNSRLFWRVTAVYGTFVVVFQPAWTEPVQELGQSVVEEMLGGYTPAIAFPWNDSTDGMLRSLMPTIGSFGRFFWVLVGTIFEIGLATATEMHLQRELRLTRWIEQSRQELIRLGSATLLLALVVTLVCGLGGGLARICLWIDCLLKIPWFLMFLILDCAVTYIVGVALTMPCLVLAGEWSLNDSNTWIVLIFGWTPAAVVSYGLVGGLARELLRPKNGAHSCVGQTARDQ